MRPQFFDGLAYSAGNGFMHTAASVLAVPLNGPADRRGGDTQLFGDIALFDTALYQHGFDLVR